IFLNRYNAIYGTFASLPIFILWLYISWSIFLYGAEISVVVQNIPWLSYFMKKDSLSIHFKILLSLLIIGYLAKNSDSKE
ncbi:YhjD/YihY/BrkB family envelope integrity protein, partial [Acinetobacter baumannii]